MDLPRFGLGTWMMKDEDVLSAIPTAYKLGYRLFDCAQAYDNEEALGKAIKGLDRGSVFLSTKVAAEIKSYDEAKKSIEESLRKLDTPYIDLLLIHAPAPWAIMYDPNRGDFHQENLGVYKAMEEAVMDGKVRHIGVSNFSIADLENILAHCSIKPYVNQICCHAHNVDSDLLEFCKGKGIKVEAYSPLGHGKLLSDEVLQKMAKEHGVPLTTLAMSFLAQIGTTPICKATSEEHLKENIPADLDLSADEVFDLLS